jgi:hypothetical protein
MKLFCILGLIAKDPIVFPLTPLIITALLPVLAFSSTNTCNFVNCPLLHEKLIVIPPRTRAPFIEPDFDHAGGSVGRSVIVIGVE